MSSKKDLSTSTVQFHERIGTVSSQQDHNARRIIRTTIGRNPRGGILTAIKSAAREQRLASGKLQTVEVIRSWEASKDIFSCNIGMVEHYLKTALIEAFDEFIAEVEKENASKTVRYTATDIKQPNLLVHTNGFEVHAKPPLQVPFEFLVRVQVTFEPTVSFT